MERRAWEGSTDEAPWPVVHAAWRDVWAAVNWTGGIHGFAVTGIEEKSPTAREFEVVTTRGESGRIRFTAARLVEGALPSDEWVTFEVDLGRFEDAAEEAAVREDLLRYRPRHAR